MDVRMFGGATTPYVIPVIFCQVVFAAFAIRSRKRSRRANAVPLKKEMRMSKGSPASAGVVYIAFGAAYRDLTVLSVLWLRRFGYLGPIRILSGDEYWPTEVLDCEIIRVPNRGEGFATRYYKTRINTFGYPTTLFLDADALPVSSIGKIWDQLASADICMSTDYYPTVQELIKNGRKERERRALEYRFMSEANLMGHPFFSSGVILFRRSTSTDQLFAIWHEEWSRFQHEDQLALVRAIARTGVMIKTLAPCWNARLKAGATIESAQSRGTRIVHLRSGNARLVRELLRDSVPLEKTTEQFWFPAKIAIRRVKLTIASILAWLKRRAL
jgi:hypothetical protein